MVLSEARKRANKKWDDQNKPRKAYISKRSTAKNFILNLATEDDLKNIKEYVIQRENELK